MSVLLRLKRSLPWLKLLTVRVDEIGVHRRNLGACLVLQRWLLLQLLLLAVVGRRRRQNSGQRGRGILDTVHWPHLLENCSAATNAKVRWDAKTDCEFEFDVWIRKFNKNCMLNYGVIVIA